MSATKSFNAGQAVRKSINSGTNATVSTLRTGLMATVRGITIGAIATKDFALGVVVHPNHADTVTAPRAKTPAKRTVVKRAK